MQMVGKELVVTVSKFAHRDTLHDTLHDTLYVGRQT